MSDDDCKIKSESVEDNNNRLDELDYEEELDTDSKYAHIKRPAAADCDSDDGAVSDSDGEVKSEKNKDDEDDDDDDDGEVKSPREGNDEFKEQQAPATPETEEDGEINDGEKVKKAFIPRVLCKYYQRGKCTWGRTCKFLHPGVNDTGNYSFLEFQDPNAKVYQQQQVSTGERPAEEAAGENGSEAAAVTESAWERGLRHAREMKEKAKQRKLAEKDQFDDKKMNLSLKEFENETENDERYFNVVQAANVDDEEDEDLHLFAQSGRPGKAAASSDRVQQHGKRLSDTVVGGGGGGRRYEDEARRHSTADYSRPRQPAGDYGRGRRDVSPFRGARGKADDWHDPWDRSRQGRRETAPRRERSKSYSSSGSRSRGRSGSRSSYSSSSSKSYSSKSSGSR